FHSFLQCVNDRRWRLEIGIGHPKWNQIIFPIEGFQSIQFNTVCMRSIDPFVENKIHNLKRVKYKDFAELPVVVSSQPRIINLLIQPCDLFSKNYSVKAIYGAPPCLQS